MILIVVVFFCWIGGYLFTYFHPTTDILMVEEGDDEQFYRVCLGFIWWFWIPVCISSDLRGKSKNEKD